MENLSKTHNVIRYIENIYYKVLDILLKIDYNSFISIFNYIKLI